ncbi:7-carboxy-7-deazaguanine synthase QueE [Micromonospora sp. NBC_01813]|uniref:7-carboxy-7-deazaguanine synthase QueE n=1 Tax=Micromonospora sp. NBC_01813 TaxID=2975988 RepID=UPI002DDBD9F4|nr:7-carboxy-7-deazaguanine synthase QueE [Micromonospora sp. NBC_01813]WSA06855.1 7-carboxy-7-deazaguanine synthase QueE [Micromonospora sp. NBC_01813]
MAELFGPTLQGEGPSTGQRAVFVRLSGCNLDCRWCDTPYTWDWTRFDQAAESREMSVEAVSSWVLSHDADLVVITGGEPLIQHRRLLPLVMALHTAGCRVEIETNGTVDPGSAFTAYARLNVSPKLAGSGIPADRRIRPDVLRALCDSGVAIFKFVISEPSDIAELVELQRQLDLSPVWVMPQGTDHQTVLAGIGTLVGPALQHGWNLSSRLHVSLWGDERGR